MTTQSNMNQLSQGDLTGNNDPNQTASKLDLTKLNKDESQMDMASPGTANAACQVT